MNDYKNRNVNVIIDMLQTKEKSRYIQKFLLYFEYCVFRRYNLQHIT